MSTPTPSRPQLLATRTGSSSTNQRVEPLVKKSARYPRVAVLLGVSKKWFVPLLLCRSLSGVFAVWWAGVTVLKLWGVVCGSVGVGVSESEGSYGRFRFRLAVLQLVLAYLWAFTAAYIIHLFAASLMSRWLLHYSPLAVLVRLCCLSILLSYVLSQLFVWTGSMNVDLDLSMVDNLERLSGSLLVWVCVAVALLLGYFLTQQDISVESDQDDRKRRLVLRFKCLVALSVTSSVSLIAILALLRIGGSDLAVYGEWLWLGWKEMLHMCEDVVALIHNRR